MNTDVCLEDDWLSIVGLLPDDIEEIGRRTGAIVRKRGVRSALDLARLALAYAQDDASLRETSAWARERGVAELSDVALLGRLRGSPSFLSELCTRLLAGGSDLRTPGGFRLVLVDSTTLCRQRSQGVDFRVHVNYDATHGRIAGVQLTRADGGEALDRLPCGPGDLLVADQGYPSRPRLSEVRSRGAHFEIRLNPTNVPLQNEVGERVDPLELCRDLKIGQILDVPLWTVPLKDAPSLAGRLVAVRKTDERAKLNLERKRKRTGKTPSPLAERAARYFLIFTSLSAERASAQQVLEIYRIRWQVEMAFKRAKGVISLGEISAKDFQLCEAKILGKLLMLLLIQAYESAFFPWGYPLSRFESLAKA